MLKIKNIFVVCALFCVTLTSYAQLDISRKNHAEYRKAGNFTFISSLPPLDPVSGKPPKEADDQVKQVFENLYTVVKESGAEMKDVVKITVYVSDRDAIMPFVDKWMDKYFTSEPYPARTPVNTTFGSRGYVVSVDAILYTESNHEEKLS